MYLWTTPKKQPLFVLKLKATALFLSVVDGNVCMTIWAVKKARELHKVEAVQKQNVPQFVPSRQQASRHVCQSVTVVVACLVVVFTVVVACLVVVFTVVVACLVVVFTVVVACLVVVFTVVVATVVDGQVVAAGNAK
jgi:Flp pilus assembly protein TadB